MDDLCCAAAARDNARVNNLSPNLRALMARHDDISENKLAQRTGVPQPTIHRILSGKVKDPRDGTLRPLAAFFGVTVEQLRTQLPTAAQVAEAPLTYSAAMTDSAPQFESDLELLIAQVVVRPQPGTPAKAPDLVPTRISVPYRLSWLQSAQATPADLFVMKVEGDGMERTLFDGDRIAVNTAQREIVDGKVYVFTTGGTEPDVKIKRLYKSTTGQIRVVSDNSDKAQFPDEFFDAAGASTVHIVGRVVDRFGSGGL